jgi:hypothetical protein
MRGGFGNFMKPLLGGILALLCAGAAQAQEVAQGPVVSLTVTVDPVKVNGSPWDGLPSVGGRILFPGEGNAPDIAVCVVLATGAPECIWRKDGSRTFSHCPDTTRCTIAGMRLSQFPVGLIFLDVDRARHDLIDYVILTEGKVEPADVAKVEANLRAAMAELTPGLGANDRKRRERKARVLPFDLCMGENAKCDLTQSRFWLERK